MLFQPQLTLFDEGRRRYSVDSVILTPHTCFSGGLAIPGGPTGVTVIPEAIPFQLPLLENRNGACPLVVTPVVHKIAHVNVPAQKSSIVCFAMLNGAVVGSSSVRFDSGHQVHMASANLEAADELPPIPFGDALELVLRNVPKPKAFTGDTTIKLRKLGVVDGSFSQALKDGIVQDLPAPFRIDPSNIKADPDNSLALAVSSVISNAIS